MHNSFSVPIIPPNDDERLAALRRYEILDTPPEGAFNRVAAIARAVLHTPVALVSLVDGERVWFKANDGLAGTTEVHRGVSLCSLAVLQDEPTVIENTLDDPCMLANPLVSGAFGLRFYAGAPLRTHDGFRIGTVCVVDQRPRSCTPAEMAILQQLAGVVMDEIELRLAARQAVRAQSELLGVAVHDLKNPLQGVLGYASLIQAAPTDPDVPDAARQIELAARRMVRLVDDVVATALHQRDEITLDLGTTAASCVVEQVVHTNQILAAHKGQRITFTSDGPCEMRADAQRLFEMVDNLVSNAIKYSPPHTVIQVGVERHGTEVRIAVEDQGPGLSQEDHERLFGQFARLSARPTGNERSTGLGLWITKRLAELHGGRVWAEPGQSGTGSCFILALPEKDDQRAHHTA